MQPLKKQGAEEQVARSTKLFGRRTGRPLRQSLQQLIDHELPQRLLVLPPEPQPLDPAALFPRKRELWLEVGFGGGEHLAEQAAANPDVGIIGAEICRNGIATLLRALVDRGCDNVRSLEEDARLLLPALPEGSLDRAFLLFPDPWPKARHHKRRFIQPQTLDQLARVLRDGAEFRLASDDPGYITWMLRHLLAHPEFVWLAQTAADWRERPQDWPPTRYEAKAIEQGRKPVFLRFQRRPRHHDERQGAPLFA